MPTDSKVDAKIIPTEPFQWPLPTLHRYHLFLREEKLLSEYDFIFYIDADMLFVSRVGDEILGDLVGAVHPMYYIRKDYIPPYEPNDKSTAFIPRIGRVTGVGDKKRFEPLYFAGGFQGGRSDVFIKAMKIMKDRIDEDFSKNNYVAIWNDESHWNKYCFENSPTVVLNPSYVYPDSLINHYYRKVWGRNFVPKLVTITKKFSLNKQGGQNIEQTIKNI
jgi:histo-blood group ABO system transferase